MPSPPKVRIRQHLHLSAVRTIQEVTSLTILIGPEQPGQWQAAKLLAQQPAEQQWNCFTVTQSARTDNPDFEEYAVTMYCRPDEQHLSIGHAAQFLAQSWNQPQPWDRHWETGIRAHFAAVENALNRYFDGDSDEIIDISTPLEQMSTQETSDLLDQMDPPNHRANGN